MSWVILVLVLYIPVKLIEYAKDLKLRRKAIRQAKLRRGGFMPYVPSYVTMNNEKYLEKMRRLDKQKIRKCLREVKL